MSPYSYFVVQQPLGWMALLATTKGLRRLSLKPQPQEALDALGPSLELATLEPKVFESVLKQFDRYFKGQNDAVDPIELDIEKSSPFFEASWAACRSIPPGETRSYSWLATAAGRPGAARAAGGHVVSAGPRDWRRPEGTRQMPFYRLGWRRRTRARRR